MTGVSVVCQWGVRGVAEVGIDNVETREEREGGWDSECDGHTGLGRRGYFHSAKEGKQNSTGAGESAGLQKLTACLVLENKKQNQFQVHLLPFL